jgi:hypothetical protein
MIRGYDAIVSTNVQPGCASPKILKGTVVCVAEREKKIKYGNKVPSEKSNDERLQTAALLSAGMFDISLANVYTTRPLYLCILDLET